MIKTETIDGMIHTWSDAGYYIHGGDPEADYDAALDPADNPRTYTETDRLIIDPTEDEEATEDDYIEALQVLGLEVSNEA